MLQKLMLLLMAALMAVSTDLYLPAIPSIIAEFGVTEAKGQLSLSVFMAGAAFGQLIYGPLSDFYGRKPVLTAGLWLFIGASAVCALAPSIEVLLTGRVLQGLTAAAGPVLARAIVSDSYPAADAASVMAALSGTMAIVPAVAPIFGGWLLLVFPWQAQFIALALIALIAWAGSLRTEETCSSIGVGGLSPRELGGRFRKCIGNRRFVGFAFCGGGAFAAMFCWISTTSFIVIDLLGVSVENFGYTFMVVICGYITGARSSSRRVHTQSGISLIQRGFVFGIAGAALFLALALTKTHSLPLLLLAMMGIFHYGGLTIANCQMGAISAFPEQAGSASSVYGFVQAMIVAIAGAVAGALYNQTLLPTILCIIAVIGLSAIGLWMTSEFEAQPPQPR